MPTKDVARMARHQEYLERFLPLAEVAVEDMQYKLSKKQQIEIHLTKHENKREFERAVSNRHIMEALENGWVIECQQFSAKSIDVLMMYYVKISSGYRPLHIALNIMDNVVTVKTVYDPRSRAEQWEENLETRIFYIQEGEKVC